ncbi:hypothetical protein GWI33_020528 [Rhynchophorus ferrugineus]|uniref:Uncharacterized protein n=1 Tax=Rhynchophorus ferrugineus TaxID=354439 RepID=A0A834M0F8_RHYFE|nr:hypothetical protein GWI33_020528 [Rhynchophorus ferrugineus]
MPSVPRRVWNYRAFPEPGAAVLCLMHCFPISETFYIIVLALNLVNYAEEVGAASNGAGRPHNSPPENFLDMVVLTRAAATLCGIQADPDAILTTERELCTIPLN